MENKEKEIDKVRFLRGRLVDEMLAIETFRNGVKRKGVKGGSIRLEHTDGSTSEYELRPDDDPQDILELVEAICYKRANRLKEDIKHFIK